MYPLPLVRAIVLAHLALSITSADARALARDLDIRAPDDTTTTAKPTTTEAAHSATALTATSQAKPKLTTKTPAQQPASLTELVTIPGVPQGVIETKVPSTGVSNAHKSGSEATESHPPSNPRDLKAGVIVGIVFGVILGFAGLFMALWLYMFRQKELRDLEEEAAEAAAREKRVPVISNPFTDAAAVPYPGPGSGSHMEAPPRSMTAVSETSLYTTHAAPSQQYQQAWRNSGLTVDTYSSSTSSQETGELVGSALQRFMDEMALPPTALPPRMAAAAAPRMETPVTPSGGSPFIASSRLRQFISLTPANDTPEEPTPVLPWSPIHVPSPLPRRCASPASPVNRQLSPAYQGQQLVIRIASPVSSPESLSTLSPSTVLSPPVVAESFPLSPFDPAADNVDIRSQPASTPSSLGPSRHTRNNSSMSFSVMSLVDPHDSIIDAYADEEEVLSGDEEYYY